MGDKQIYKKEIGFGGKLITALDAAQIGDNFQSLKNMRYTQAGVRPIGGMTKINSNGWNATYTTIKSAFHFTKGNPQESHILIEASNAGGTASRIYSNTNVPPVADEFTVASLYSPDSTSNGGRWSLAPNGMVAYCNGAEACLYGGTESEVGAVIRSASDITTTVTDPFDFTDQLRNDLSDANNRMAITGGTSYWIIGSPLPINGVKYYIHTANASAATMTGYYWNGTAWTALTLTDGTATGGKSLAQTGTVTFTTPASKVQFFYGMTLYWYKFTVSAGSPIVYKVTTSIPFQTVKDIPDGAERQILSCYRYDGSEYADVSTDVSELDFVSGAVNTYAELNSATSSWEFFFGFSERMMGINFYFVVGNVNTNASNATVAYWDGDSWVNVSGQVDGTSNGTDTLSRNGTITWAPPSQYSEFKKEIETNTPFYYYRLKVSSTLSANVALDKVSGIAAQKPLNDFVFPVYAQDRLWLCRENKALCSSAETANVFNGDDSTEIVFGDAKDLTGGAWLYSQYGSSIYNMIIFFKANEMWGLIGSDVEDWQKFRISDTIGCVAPHTIRTVDLPAGVYPGLNRNVVVFQGANGVYMSDGRTPICISEDISSYFDKRSTHYINQDYIDDSTAFYDVDNNEYHIMFTSQSATSFPLTFPITFTYAEKEFAFNFKKGGWYEVNRTSGKNLKYGIEVKSSLGATYNYGFYSTSYMLRLENGQTMDGTAIPFEIQFGDIAPHEGSVVMETNTEYQNLVCRAKTGTDTSITVTHYGDGETTATYTWTASPQKSGYRLIYPVKHKTLGGHVFHSFKFTTSSDDENYGFEPLFFIMRYSIARDKNRDWRE